MQSPRPERRGITFSASFQYFWIFRPAVGPSWVPHNVVIVGPEAENFLAILSRDAIGSFEPNEPKIEVEVSEEVAVKT
jgi:hypothetical protein